MVDLKSREGEDEISEYMIAPNLLENYNKAMLVEVKTKVFLVNF